MPIRFPVNTFFEVSGNSAAEFTEAVRDGVATFACDLWSAFPDFITDGINPANSFARGYMNRMCSPIQPPLPAPTAPFTGGQCCDGAYDVTADWDLKRCFGNVTVATGPGTVSVVGRVKGLVLHQCTQNPSFRCLDVEYEDCMGTVQYETLVSTTREITDDDCSGVPSTDPEADNINRANSTFSITGIVRTDGMPDDCGDPFPRYDSPPPTSDDLNEIINVTINDGLDLALELQYIKLSNQYNFPMNFKVNGTNVVLDFGGINFYAPDGFGSPSGGNDVPPPGSDPGEDGAGDTITKTFPDSDYPVGPDSPVTREVATLIEYLICTDGVISTVQESLKLAVGFNPIFVLIIDILGQILTDLCETPEASLGLPEYYGLRIGVDRPAIVYLWKEFVGGKWGASTYSSTVSYPTAAAIADIPNLLNIQKFTGQFKRTVALTDGSQIRTTGNTEAAADANFSFLVNQVDPSFLPSPLNDFIIESEDTRIATKTLTLRQVEYYPEGKKDNVGPTIKRVINP